MTYLSQVLADAPVHYWRLADPAGNVANDIGSARPLPLFGVNVAYGMLGYSGPNTDGGSAVLATSSGWIGSIGMVHAAVPLSIDWCVWLPGPQQVAAQGIYWGFEAANTNFSNYLATGILAHNFGSGASVPIVLTPANVWHHCALTYAAGAVAFSFYIDGVLVSAPATTVVPAYDAQLLIGRRGSGSVAGAAGAISEFAIYNSALSAARVAAHAAARDSAGVPPVFMQAGRFDLAAGVSAPLQSQITGITNGLSRTWLNAP